MLRRSGAMTPPSNPCGGLSRRDVLVRGLSAAAAGEAALLRSAGAANAAASFTTDPRNAATYYPESFGAQGDGINDDTTAIQSCIDHAAGAGGGTIQFGPKTYIVNHAPRHDRSGNAILALPNSQAQRTLRLQGVGQATQIRTTLSDQSYSPRYGTPSLLGGPTPEQLGRTGSFSLWTIELSAVTVVVPTNPTVCGVDLCRVARAEVQNSYVLSANPTGARPSHPYSFGLRLPDGLNYNRVLVNQLDIYGFHTGIICNTAHTIIQSAVAKWCLLGCGLTGSGEYDAIDPHASLFQRLSTEACAVHIAGWTPHGTASLPAQRPFYLVMSLWDIEDSVPGRWYSTQHHLLDQHNQIHGSANYLHVRSNIGTIKGHLRDVGGSHLRLTDLAAR